MADRGPILVFATKGSGSNDETRILELLGDHDVERYEFDRARKLSNVPRIVRRARARRVPLIVMEGTGIAGGLAVLLARALFGIPFVVSSGDAVAPFLAGTRPVLGVPAWIYERLLYRCGAGFIGWTPYLVGRAISLGGSRGVTAAGFPQHPGVALTREEVRAALGVPQDALLFGIVGSLDWNANKGYCYGLELVEAVRRAGRADVAVAVVGGGSGLERLRAAAGPELGRRVFIPGPVEPRFVESYLAAMDVGSLPQTLDPVGALRYTTKISEYVAARLPLVTGQLPLAYDVADLWSWRLPGETPWSEEYLDALASLMDEVTIEEVHRKRDLIASDLQIFDRADQRRRVGAFVADLLDERRD
jgi:Glycosyl transferases group 1